MSNVSMLVNDSISSIAEINARLHSHLNTGEFHLVPDLIEERSNLINRLISLSSNVQDKSFLVKYFIDLKDNTEKMMRTVSEERHKVAQVLSNIRHVKVYIAV